MTAGGTKKFHERLFQACERNDLEEVRNFIEVQGIPISSCNHDNETPAHSAVKKCHMSTLKYLLEKQPDLQNAKDIHGNNILHLATMCGSLDLVKYLIDERGMDIYEPASAHLGNGAVHMTAFAGWVHLLKYFVKERQVDVNLRNRIGQPLAFAAALNKKLKVIKYLVEEHNANLFLTDDNNNNILLISASIGDLSIPIYLLEEMKMKFKVDWTDRFGRTVLHHAARGNHFVLLKYFVIERNADFNAQDNMGRSPLHEAAEKNHLEIVKYLMERGASVFVEDNFGKTPLQVTKDKHVIQYLEQYVPPERKRRNIQESFLTSPSTHLMSSIQKYIAGKSSNEMRPGSSPFSQHVNEFLLLASIRYANKTSDLLAVTPLESVCSRIDTNAVDAVNAFSAFEEY